MIKATTKSNRVVAYYRVSTQKQGASGLGLDAQRASVQQYAHTQGLTIVSEFTEIETGTNKRVRRVLQEAIERTKSEDARLLIAKLDRLSRSVAFTASLLDSKVPFTAVDNPNMNELVIHILAAINQDEADRISQRTKAALQAAKARGTKLGTPANLTVEARAKGHAAKRQQAIDAYSKQLRVIRMMRKQNMSLRAIAKAMNDDGHKTRTGAAFTGATVKRILDRTK